MKRILSEECLKLVDKKVLLSGWVNSRRDHGKIIFIDLRDRGGLIQVVFTPQVKKVYELASSLKPEYVISVSGKASKRPEKMVNPKIPTGKIEIEAETLEVLSEAKTLPFPIDNEGYEISEDLRLKYRYLDLRRPRMRKNLELRGTIQNFARDFLKKKGFWEIETPILTKSTPEGARDFIVPSRMHPHQFYALPQSPQQYKQLLMVAGIEKYFQFARCFRDEDIRSDRSLEFTQLDIEVSFMPEEEILNLVEELVIGVSEKIVGKKIQKKPFPRLTFEEAMKRYGKDSPDLRKNKKDNNILAYGWIIDFPMFEKKEDGSISTCHHPFTALKQEDVKLLDKKDKLLKIRAQQYDLVLNGHEVFGGSIRTINPKTLAKVFRVLGHVQKEIKEKFGHLLEAFEYGVPPHGGIAASDRWIEVMLGEPTIREVIPFPTTGQGVTSVMEAPSPISEDQLKELHLSTKK